MKKIVEVLKVIAYWITIIGPIIDMVIGGLAGLSKKIEEQNDKIKNS